MTDLPLFVHAGAHRTGSSSFQMCLHKNRAELDEAGLSLAYPGRDGIPSGDLELRLPGTIGMDVKDKMYVRAQATLERHSGGRPLILSEENILGRMYHFLKGRFYPMLEARCDVLRAAWPGPVAHVLLVVRPYDGLYVSGFRKRAEDNAVRPFDELRHKYMAMDRGWPEIVAVLRDVLRPEQLTVLPYADRGTSVSLLQRLAPDLAGTALIEPERIMNLSATDAALEALQTFYRDGQKLRRPKWKTVMARHAKDTEPRGFAAFTAQEIDLLSARYSEDLDRISKMDGVNFG